jgi:hypothetical protein
MALTTATRKYLPGMYPGRQRDPAEAAGLYVKAWEKKRLESKPKTSLTTELPPTICFARRIGVGALEIADILAEKIRYRVADRLIIEEMAGHSAVAKKTVDFFDERYPGSMNELRAFLFGEKSFIMSDYTRGLTGVIHALAMSEPTIFVGRCAHLLLPRERVFAVHIICSRQFRVKRIARIMDVSEDVASKKLTELDNEQLEFFKRMTGKKEPSAEEFDLVINCDFIRNPQSAAEIAATAFQCKFLK